MRVLLFALLFGCGPSLQQTIVNPLVHGSVPRNRVSLLHDYAERRLGVASGTATDLASIDRLDEKRICFSLTLHDFAQLDPDGMEAMMQTPAGDTADVTWISAKADDRTVDSLVTASEDNGGVEHTCTRQNRRGRCVSWQDQPTYDVVQVPGSQYLAELTTRACFPNAARLTTASKWVGLTIRVPRLNAEPWMGGHIKEAKFGWGFTR